MSRRISLAFVGAAFAIAGCQTVGQTWSEVTGVRYHDAIADRWPSTIVAVGDGPAFLFPVQVAPGTYRITVRSPSHDGFPGTVQDIELTLEPCRRYYINAQFAARTGGDWRPVVDWTERIQGCRVTAS